MSQLAGLMTFPDRCSVRTFACDMCGGALNGTSGQSSTSSPFGSSRPDENLKPTRARMLNVVLVGLSLEAVVTAVGGALVGGGVTFWQQKRQHAHENATFERNRQDQAERKRAEACTNALKTANGVWYAALNVSSTGGQKAWEEAMLEQNHATALLRNSAGDVVDAYHALAKVSSKLADTVREQRGAELSSGSVQEMQQEWRAARDRFLESVNR